MLYLWRRWQSHTDVSGVAQVEDIVVIVAQAVWTIYWLVSVTATHHTGSHSPRRRNVHPDQERQLFDSSFVHR